MTEIEPTVNDNIDAHRYEITIDATVATLAYLRDGNTITLVHTEVPPALQGRGLANILAKHAFETALKEKVKVIVLCPFVKIFLKRHPEYTFLTE
jgi:predicted GNAT family acetyltransferase